MRRETLKSSATSSIVQELGDRSNCVRTGSTCGIFRPLLPRCDGLGPPVAGMSRRASCPASRAALPFGACSGKHLMQCGLRYQHPPTDIENRN